MERREQEEGGQLGASENMAASLIRACRSLALSTWLLSFCFVHLLCLDFTVAEKEEWYTAFVNITYRDPLSSETVTEKTECGRYGEHSPKRDARGVVAMPSSTHDRQTCDPATRFALPPDGGPWVALIARGNCTYKEKIRNAASRNASAVVIYNVGSGNANETITMPHQGECLALSSAFTRRGMHATVQARWDADVPLTPLPAAAEMCLLRCLQ